MSANRATGGDCGCGCGCGEPCTCESRCCELECLVRPNFFCGQLLTDADLASMVEWTRKRFALSRYRDGWGIVCGLDLSCSEPDGAGSCCDNAKGAKGPAVWLAQGYAVDCCGNDLVVCEPTRIDLSSVCRLPDDPCNPEPPARPAAPTPPRTDDRRGDRTCFDVDHNSLFAVQVVLRYHEDPAQGQRAMFRGGGACGNTEACEYARTLERPCVHLEVVPLPVEGEDDTSEEEQWLQDFRGRATKLIHEVQELVKKGPDAVVQHLHRHPPYQFCYLLDLAGCLREKNKDWFAEKEKIQFASLLFHDVMARELKQCSCFACKPDNGVSLGVVILRRSTEGRRTTCKVYSINAEARYRRRLKQQVCQQFLAGDLALLRFLGQSETSVLQQFEASGVKVERKDRTGAGITSLGELASVVENQTMRFNPLERTTLWTHVVVDPLGTPRIIAFE